MALFDKSHINRKYLFNIMILFEIIVFRIVFYQKRIDREVEFKILCDFFQEASVAQLVEHHLAKVDVESSNLFARSIF